MHGKSPSGEFFNGGLWRSLIVNWPTPKPILYGAKLTSQQLDASSSQAGEFTYLPRIGVVLTAGHHVLSVVFQPSDASHFKSATASVTLQVERSPKIVSPDHASLVVSKSVTFAVTTIGWPLPSISEKGKLPPGMTFRTTAMGMATISGTPTGSGKGKRYTVYLTAYNAIGSTNQRLILTVS